MQQRIKNINQHIILKKLTGVLILCTFLLSITPKLTLHSFTSHHKDETSKKITDKEKVQFNEFGYNCDCNNIVATSPFTEAITSTVLQPQLSFAPLNDIIAVSFSSNARFYFSLRGPPAVI